MVKQARGAYMGNPGPGAREANGANVALPAAREEYVAKPASPGRRAFPA